MLNCLLAYWTPGPLELIVVFVMALITFSIPFLIIRSFIRNKRETQKLRFEVGEMADELEQLRKKSDQNENDSTES